MKMTIFLERDAVYSGGYIPMFHSHLAPFIIRVFGRWIWCHTS